jgi:hypothetical protein
MSNTENGPVIGGHCSFHPRDDDPLSINRYPYLARITAVWPPADPSADKLAVDLAIEYGAGLTAQRNRVRWWSPIDGAGPIDRPYAADVLES